MFQVFLPDKSIKLEINLKHRLAPLRHFCIGRTYDLALSRLNFNSTS